ncbi:MAG TPA: diguanylate cyclase [Rhizobacter sp.]|nr:diguanylate cyclase [Rhizobacter sp.]
MGTQQTVTTFPLGRVVAISNVLILGLIAATAVHMLRLSHQAHLEQARQATENLALTLSAGIASDIKQIDNVLASTRMQVDSAQPVAVGAPRVAVVAENNRLLVPEIDALRVTDAQGQVLNGDGPGVVMVNDRPYFEEARSAPGKLVFSEPLQDRIIRKWGLVLARARTDDDGRFQGIVYAVLSNDYFLHSFENVRLGGSGAVSLRTGSLSLVARYVPGQAGSDASIGTRHVSPELKAALAADPAKGFYVSHTAIDGLERANAYHRVEGYPLMVIVGLSTEDFYSPWKREVATIAGVAGLLAAMVIALSLLVSRAQSALLKMHRSIETLAAEQQVVLDNELVGMARLHNRVEVWHNRALDRMFGYELGELSGTPARLLHADDESFQRIGLAYALLDKGEKFRTQLRMRRKDGSLIWIDLSGVRLPNGESLWMMVDITALKETEFKARHMALHDSLTGLANRSGLEADLGALLDQARRDGSQVALCFVDLDGFKNVNDQHGHEAGDTLLRMAAQRIASCTRSHDMVARLGGDEFVVVLTQLHDPAEIVPALERVVEVLSTPFSVGGGVEARIGASLGVAVFPQDGGDVDSLLSKADAAMYAAKRTGKGRFAFHSEDGARAS